MKTTLEELQTFVAVVDTGAVSKAAAALGQTVSAASRTLRRLEDKLSTTLLLRTTRRLALTNEGAAFLAHARHILAAVDAAEEDLAARRDTPCGPLRVDAASPFMMHVIAPLVASYRALFPQVVLELCTNEHVIDLLERRTDVAIRIGALPDSTLHARAIGSSGIRVLASPAYLAAHGRPRDVADLAHHTLLGFSRPETLNDWPLPGLVGERAHGRGARGARGAAKGAAPTRVATADDGARLRIVPSLRASSGETLRQLALEGAGIVCLSDFMTRDDRAAGRLVPLLVRQSLAVRQPIHAVYYRNTAVSARIQSFVDHLIEGTREQGFD